MEDVKAEPSDGSSFSTMADNLATKLENRPGISSLIDSNILKGEENRTLSLILFRKLCYRCTKFTSSSTNSKQTIFQ